MNLLIQPEDSEQTAALGDTPHASTLAAERPINTTVMMAPSPALMNPLGAHTGLMRTRGTL